MHPDHLNVFLDAAQTLNFSETAQRLPLITCDGLLDIVERQEKGLS